MVLLACGEEEPGNHVYPLGAGGELGGEEGAGGGADPPAAPPSCRPARAARLTNVAVQAAKVFSTSINKHIHSKFDDNLVSIAFLKSKNHLKGIFEV